MIAVWLIAAAALLLFIAGSVLCCIACLRVPMGDISDEAFLKKSNFNQFAALISQSAKQTAQLPMEDWWTESHDGKKLHANFYSCENAAGTLLMAHGYRSSWHVDFSISIPFYHAQGFNLLLIDQRACEQSEGKFITFGVKERMDVQKWAAVLGQKLGEDHPVFLCGLSMGAATVLMAADLDFAANVRGIVADCGFTDPYSIMKSVVRSKSKLLPWKPMLALAGIFTRLYAGFGLHEVSTLDTLRRTHYPILFFHGKKDDFVPYQMTQQAFDACTSEKELILVEGAGHGASYLAEQARVQSAIENFLQKHLPKETEE